MSVNGKTGSSAVLVLGVLLAGSLLIQALQEKARYKNALEVREEYAVDVGDAGGIADAFNRLRTD